MPDVVDGRKITASPEQLRSAGQEWGAKANNYDQMNLRLQTVSGRLPPGKFQGHAGDTVRGYLQELTSSSGKLAEAYNKIAIKAPRVADAIRDAKQAQDRLETAQNEADDARRKLDTAGIELVAAEAAVTAQRGIHDILGAPGPSEAAKQAVERAKQRVSGAEHVVTEKDKALRKAKKDFHDADHDRKRMSHDFAELVNDQTRVIRKALPPAPAAPQVPALASQLGVLNMGRGAIFTLFGAQMNLARELVDPSMLRVGKNGLYRLPKSVKVFSPSDLRTLETLEKWGSRLDKIGKVAGIAGPLATSSIEAFSDPHLTPQQRQDYIVNHVLLEGGIGLTAASACAPAGALAATGCGYLGGQGGKVLEKSHLARRATNGVSHIVVNPYVETGTDIAHGHYVEGLKDGALIWPRIGFNAITQVAPTPSRIKGIANDLAHDAKGVANFAEKKNDDFLSKLDDGLSGRFIRGL